jgi:predicted esterase
VTTPNETPQRTPPWRSDSDETDANKTPSQSVNAGTRSPGHFVLLDDETPGSVLWVPATPERRPLLVFTHGAGGTPEWHCEHWAALLQQRAFVLCVRGKAMSRAMDSFFYPEHFDLGRRLTAALQSLDLAYGERLTEGGHVFGGYSQGATMGSVMIDAHAERFRLLLFVEGGYQYWSAQRARQYQRAGGQRVFIACGTETCKRAADKARPWFAATELQLSVGHAPGAGHTPVGEVGEHALRGLEWLVSDNQHWHP